MKFPQTVHKSRLEMDLDKLAEWIKKRKVSPRQLSAYKKGYNKQPTPTGYR